ncbi:zf-DHHC-domain-containing protein [Clavulina sp. PMI_390]|nr:zf-DHHC-domain-containing protein [Clavulina sp. PMI_390]
MGKLVERLWVGGTTSLIGFIAYTSQIFVLWPWYGREFSVQLLSVLGPFNILVGILYWNYFSTVHTPPGNTPPGWDAVYEGKRSTSAPRYCRSCKQYKPPRAHHCRQCNKYVLKLPWVNNCVGHNNYAHFIRFLILVDICCSYHLVMMTSCVMDIMNRWNYPMSTTQLIIMILNFTLCIPVLLMVGGFSLYHFYCVATNTTTIEAWEKDKVATLIRRGKIREVRISS